MTLLPTASLTSTEGIIRYYFKNGYPYSAIIQMLRRYHGKCISLRTLHRRLRSYNNLRRRNSNYRSQTVTDLIVDEINRNGNTKGYRAMHQILVRKGCNVNRETVRQALKEIDPEGVKLRSKNRLERRKYFAAGPNDIWHVDGNDKLKPYGFSIHGCIDGYSRKIIWLKLSPSNKNPAEIAHHYLTTVKEVNGFPRRMRSDRGVENFTIAGMQRYFLRNQLSNPQNAFLFGKSTANQRIEAWWSFLLKRSLNKWMNYFKDLIDQGLYFPDKSLEREIFQFSFYGLLQDELDEIVSMWNQHRIRCTRNCDSPGGIPNILYFLPSLTHTSEKKIPIRMHNDIVLAQNFTKTSPQFGCSSLISNFCLTFMRLHGLDLPKDRHGAEQLFQILLNAVNSFV